MYVSFIHLKLGLLTQFTASNYERHTDRKGIPPVQGQGEYPSYLCIFHSFKAGNANAFTAANYERHIDRKGIPPGRGLPIYMFFIVRSCKLKRQKIFTFAHLYN